MRIEEIPLPIPLSEAPYSSLTDRLGAAMGSHTSRGRRDTGQTANQLYDIFLKQAASAGVDTRRVPADFLQSWLTKNNWAAAPGIIQGMATSPAGTLNRTQIGDAILKSVQADRASRMTGAAPATAPAADSTAPAAAAPTASSDNAESLLQKFEQTLQSVGRDPMYPVSGAFLRNWLVKNNVVSADDVKKFATWEREELTGERVRKAIKMASDVQTVGGFDSWLALQGKNKTAQPKMATAGKSRLPADTPRRSPAGTETGRVTRDLAASRAASEFDDLYQMLNSVLDAKPEWNAQFDKLRDTIAGSAAQPATAAAPTAKTKPRVSVRAATGPAPAAEPDRYAVPPAPTDTADLRPVISGVSPDQPGYAELYRKRMMDLDAQERSQPAKPASRYNFDNIAQDVARAAGPTRQTSSRMYNGKPLQEHYDEQILRGFELFLKELEDEFAIK